MNFTFSHLIKILRLLPLFGLLTGCISLGPTFENKKGEGADYDVLKNHVIMFNLDGHPVDPTGNHGCREEKSRDKSYTYCEGKFDIVSDYPELEEEDFKKHIFNILEKAKEHAETYKMEKIQLLFFVHGGLNTQKESLERVVGKGPDPNQENKTLRDLIMKDKKFYPIFINWQSFLTSSYGDHLVNIRQGEKQPWSIGWPTAPIVLAVDIGRSLLRAPLVWGSMISNDGKTAPDIDEMFGPEKNLPDEVVQDLLCQNASSQEDCFQQFKASKSSSFSKCRGQNENIRQALRRVNPKANPGVKLIIGVDERRCTEMAWNFLKYLITFPAKIVTSPFFDAFGKSAWDNMLRSIQLLFQVDEEFHYAKLYQEDILQPSKRTSSGGLHLFLNELLNKIHENKSGSKQSVKKELKWEITWVGHSAGTLIINEAIRRFGLPKEREITLPFNNIVYMAAAATLRDIETSVYPYLQNNSDHSFFHLMLHKRAEEGEIPWVDLIPRGSLLVWIDQFLSNPLTHKERTAGRYENFFLDFHSIQKEIQSQISLRVFSNGEKVKFNNPMKHGEFTTRFRFWDEACWFPEFNQTNEDPCVYP